MSINQAKRGDPGVAAVDLCDRPIFGFGNGGENQCASTVNLRIAANQRQGELRVRCLDTGDGPLQLSVDSLRKMKAVVDFAEDLICFRALDPRRVVKVERSATEHQLLPMTEDLLATARVPREDGGTEPSGMCGECRGTAQLLRFSQTAGKSKVHSVAVVPGMPGVETNLSRGFVQSTEVKTGDRGLKKGLCEQSASLDVPVAFESETMRKPLSCQVTCATSLCSSSPSHIGHAPHDASSAQGLAVDGTQEHAHTAWTKIEIQHRIQELDEYNGVTRSDRNVPKISVQEAVRELRKATKKKATLVEHCQNVLGTGPELCYRTARECSHEAHLSDRAGGGPGLAGLREEQPTHTHAQAGAPGVRAVDDGHCARIPIMNASLVCIVWRHGWRSRRR